MSETRIHTACADTDAAVARRVKWYQARGWRYGGYYVPRHARTHLMLSFYRQERDQ